MGQSMIAEYHMCWVCSMSNVQSRSDCRTVMNRYNECIRRSYVDYQNAYSQGEDGRPDWQARKTCNYITASIGECPSQLLAGGCKTQEEVTTMKDALIGETLKRVKETVDHWESTKCPAVRSYMERLGILPVAEAQPLHAEDRVESLPSSGEPEGQDCQCFMDSIVTQVNRLNRAWTAFMTVWSAV